MFACVSFIPGIAQAQEDATQQQIDQINVQIQNLQAVLVSQDKHIQAIEKEISDLRDRLNQPDTNNFASADDLKKLAEQVQEIDKKRQSDNEAILKELEKLDKALNVASSSHKTVIPESVTTNDSTSNGGSKQNGYWQTIGDGYTISAIAKTYQDKGIKVTWKQILDANPGLDPKNLKIGQKIWIPAPQP